MYAAEVGDHRNDRHVIHAGIGPGAERRVVEQRVDRHDDVGIVLREDVFEAFAIERLAKAHDRAVAATAVGRVVERAVNRWSKAEGRAVGRPQFG